MKKLLLVVGIVILFTGFILTSYSYKSEQTITSEQIAHVTNAWSLSANLTKDDKMLVGILPGTNWIQSPFDDSGISGLGYLYCSVNVSDPSGSAAWFALTWAYYPQQPLAPISLWNISQEGESDGLDTSTLYRPNSTVPYEGIGGITTKSGLYTVKVYGIYPPLQGTEETRDPPSDLEIRKGLSYTGYPYMSFLPIGIVFAVVGSMVVIFGLSRGAKKKLVKTKYLDQRKK